MTFELKDSDNLVPVSQLNEQQQQALLNIVYRIRESLDVQQILNTTTLEIRQMLGADRVGIFRFKPHSGYRIGEFVAESLGEGLPSAIATPVRDQCFGDEYARNYQNGRIQAVSDIHNANLSQCHIDVLAQFKVRANLIVPLRIKGHLWGLFCVHQCHSSRDWQTQEIEFIRHLGHHLDIALQQGELLEHTLEQSARLRSLTQERDRFFSLSPNLFCVIDFDGEFIRVNPAWEDILGYVQDELINSNFWSFVHPDDEELTEEAWRKLQESRGREALLLEHRFRCADGKYKYLSWSGTCISREKRIYAIARDITKRKQLEFTLGQRTRDLEQALAKLQQTQVHLVQSAKMSSLGQLVAGVAHEINNPMNFIYGNIGHIQDYTSALVNIVDAYQQSHEEQPPDIVALCQEADLEFILDDLPAIISSLQLGAERIKKIITSLRNFSRLDEAPVKMANIHEGIDSTILILQNRIKAKPHQPEITIQKRYGDLPEVECYPGQLNQVFMNILSNAIDAIIDSKKSNNGVISISTAVLTHEQAIAIMIRDNGYGMDEQTCNRIFDPFFTTKDVGKGTGLGMSISYQIITEHHHGSLACKSQQGVGTEFTITLPINQSTS
ncbi:multi-sensor signal transduction histidine kinase [[Leptolyngbya] sp. PCC 7376]|uniref:GAF domain-containing sensor histidine kinase n=1 Tax=[Leptolyngbya] sp. PCC 7376 TaxID=111781 RepID=UPI00029ECAB7|nr:ATP-binding protein [[Leptolyngbya] sp. PCC 7376]AFY39423.1 multi-sensor signal transduction histidine kinase [[Leptolyngbya] sp. PCC 7376]